MIDTTHIHALMEREVSRKEFLRYVGVALLSIIGVTNFIKNLSQPLQLPATAPKQLDNKLSGYGHSAYGR